MYEQEISLPTPPSPTLGFDGYTFPEEADSEAVRPSGARTSFKYPDLHPSPVKRQRDFKSRNNLKRKHQPTEDKDGAAAEGIDSDHLMEGFLAVFEGDVGDGADTNVEGLELVEPGIKVDDHYEAYVEAVLADVAGFFQLRESLFVVQGWNKQAGNVLVREK